MPSRLRRPCHRRKGDDALECIDVVGAPVRDVGARVGEPVYDQTTCIGYVVTKLEENGFFIKYVHPGTLFISWDNWVPAYTRAEIKKRTGLILDEHGTVVDRVEKKEDALDVSAASNGATQPKPGAKQYKSISEYKPTGNLVYGKDAMDNLEKKVVKFNL